MMTRVTGQMQPGSYNDILRQTEQEGRQPANTVYQPPPQQPPPMQQPPAYPPQQYPPQQYPPQQQQMPEGYYPADGQPPNFAAGMGPWAGLPGAQSAFEAAPVGSGGQPQMVEDWGNMSMPSAPAPASDRRFWSKYRDWILVAIIVFVLLFYGLPQARRYLPTVFGGSNSFATSSLLALVAGCTYHASSPVLPR